MNSGRRTSVAALRGRSLQEIGFRGVQAASAALERLGLDRREIAPSRLFQHLTADAQRRHQTIDRWAAAFRSRGGTGFLGGLDDPLATVARCRHLDRAGCDVVISRAERALDGRLDILGLSDVEIGSTVDWHRDPVLDVRAPLRHWSRIPYLNPGVVGDHKRIWEVNRHQWLVTLCQAWLLTGDDRHASAVAAALRSWMDQNPPKVGVNWASSLEVALRAISWLWCLRLLGPCPHLHGALVARMVGHLLLSARHIARNLSTYFSPNTHLTGEALALFYLGTELAEFRGAARWRDTGRRILLEQLPIHVRADGTYFEQSTWYHRYTFDFYLHFHLLEQRAHATVHPGVADALRRMAEVLQWIARPDGSMPLIGDDDGGRLLFLDGRMPTDVRPALANAAAITGDPTFLAAGAPSQELVWLFSRDAVDRVLALTPKHPAGLSRHFPNGGVVVLRDGWGPRSSVMTVDAGPHGTASGGHAHADSLCFDLCVGGMALLVDPGTCEYTVHPETRDRFRHTAVHNGATLGGASSSEVRGPFTWGRRAEARVERFLSTPEADYFRGSHDGFTQLPQRATYARSLFYVREGLWVLRDEFVAESAVSCEVHFQCDRGVDVALTTAGTVELLADGGHCRLWAPDATSYLSVETGEVSPLFGVAHPAWHIRVAGPSARRGAVHTVIAAPALDVRDVAVTTTPGGAVVTITREAVVDYVGFGPCDLEGHPVRAAAAAWWVQQELGSSTVRRSLGVECTELRVSGSALIP